jgi:hypothetical protein
MDTPIMGGDSAGAGAMPGVMDGGVAVGVAVGVGAIPSHVQELGLQVCPGAQRLLVHTGGPQAPTSPLHTQVLPDGTHTPMKFVPQVPPHEPHGPPGVAVGVADGVADGLPGTSQMQVAGLHVCGAEQRLESQVGGPQAPPSGSVQIQRLPAGMHVPVVPQGPPQAPQDCTPACAPPTCRSNTIRSIA